MGNEYSFSPISLSSTPIVSLSGDIFFCSAHVMRKIISYLLTYLLVDFISDYFGSWELFPKVVMCCLHEGISSP